MQAESDAAESLEEGILQKAVSAVQERSHFLESRNWGTDTDESP